MTHLPRLVLLRKPEVLNRLGLSRSTFYSRMADGILPKPISLGDRAVGWLEHEINTVIAHMAAGKSNNEIKALVSSLVEQRQSMLEALNV